MNGENNSWNVNQAKFQGYVKATLEDINKKLDQNSKVHKDLYDKIEAHDKMIMKMKTNWNFLLAIGSTMLAVIAGVAIYMINKWI